MLKSGKDNSHSISFISNNPIEDITEDRFNYIDLVETIQYSILNSPPLHSIGLFGELGVGKSSILHILKNKLKDSKFEFLIIDAWKFSPEFFKQEFLLEIIEQIKSEDK